MFGLDNLSKHLYSLVYPILKVLGMAPSTAAKYPNYLLRSESGALNEASIHVFRDTLAGYYADESRETSRVLRVSKIVLYKNMAAPRPPQHEYLVAWVEADGCTPSLVKIERRRSPKDHQDEQPDEQPDERPDEQPDEQPDERTPKRGMFALDLSSASESCKTEDQKRFADDKITSLPHPPSDDMPVLTLKFGGNNTPLYFYQLVVLARAVHDHSEYYNLFKANCYWYAGVICGILRQQFPSVAITESDEYDPHSCYGPLGVKLWHIMIDINEIDFWKEVKNFEEQEIGKFNRRMRMKDEEIQDIIKAKDEEIQGMAQAVRNKDAEIRQKEKENEELRKKLDSLMPNSNASEAQNTSSDPSQNLADVPENRAGTSANAAKATAAKSTVEGGRVREKKTSMIKV